jgi:ATP-binding cassette subfamily B protein
MISNLKRLFKVLDRWKWHYVFSGVLMILSLFVRSLEPKILQITVDNVIAFFSSGGSEGQFANDFVSRFFYSILPRVSMDNLERVLISLGIIYMVISILRGGFLLSASALTASSSEKAIKKLRDTLFSHIQTLPLHYFNVVPKGELIQRSTGDVDTVRRFILNQIVEVVRMTAIFLFSFTMMYIVNPRYALISVVFSPLLIISSYLFFKKERKVWARHEAEADRLNSIVQENLNGIRVVQAFANEKYEIERFERQNKRKLGIGLKQVLLHAFYWPASDFLVNLQVTISIIAGGYFAITNQITVGELLSFYSYIMMVSWPMRQVGRVLSQMGMALVAIERIYKILQAEPEKQDGSVITHRLKGEIEFKDVHFSYDGHTSEKVLAGISFKIQAGEKIAFIGPTGSGKSTIISLLVSLYEPDQGKILIDGQNIKTLSKRSLRKKIGVVLQTPFLFSTTVRGNIVYANPTVEESKILNSLKIAKVDEIEDVLPDGFNTLVGEKGVTLSGGQKQRVALARTLLSQPDILVLDDVTSAVDTQTEHSILQALEEPMSSKTTIIISHRITSIQKADRILVLSNGKIVQEGIHAELVKRDGYYKEIHTIQTALEKEIYGVK